MADPTFHYTIDCRKPGSHVYDITLEIANLPPARHTLTLPVWTPGAYQVADFARHIFNLAIKRDDQALEVYHLKKNQWGFDTHEEGAILVHYQVWALELSTGTSHLDQSHAYFNGAQLFFLVDQYKGQPLTLSIEAPAEWRVSTGLNQVDDNPYQYQADNYDILIDSPFEIGTQRVTTFHVDEKVHEIAVWGHGNENLEVLTADVRDIVQAQRNIFRGLPYDHYTFILHLSDRRTGGLEHLNSTTCGTERFSFQSRKKYRRVLQLISHEFFHLWNVKRIHPEMLGPFDYNQEVYTHLLWAMEGFTDYFASLSLRHAKLFSTQEYLDSLADRIKAYEKLPGRFVHSLSESSFDTWIKLYKPDADSPNRTISYYLKGDLVGTCLDLEIRQRTHNQFGLDEVLRRLYDRYGAHGIGFPESAYQETVEEVAGSSLQEFFERYIDGTEPIPFEQFLGYAGLSIERQYKHPDRDDEHDRANREQKEPVAWLGLDVQVRNGHELVVQYAYTSGPAADRLNPGDQLIALNGFQIENLEQFKERITQDFSVGDTVNVAFFRRGELLSAAVPLAASPVDTVRITHLAHPTPEQKALYEAWLHADWETDSPSK